MGSRNRLLRAFAVVVMGGAAQLIAPAPAFAVSCSWCWDHCPADINQFCHDHGCAGGEGSSCGYTQCKDVYGSWWNYRIDCGLF